MNTVSTHLVDKNTAKDAIMMCLSKAIIYGDKFDYDYDGDTLTIEYENTTNRKAWITNDWN